MITAAYAFAVGSVLADTTPIMLSLWDPVQFPSDEYDVMGLRLSALCECRDFTGLDVGLLQCSQGDFCWVAVGGSAKVDGSACGVHITGLGNCVGNDLHGVQIAGWGNEVKCDGYGIFVGALWGNRTKDIFGMQIGLINGADAVGSGVQIGLWNHIGNNGWASNLPIVNGHF